MESLFACQLREESRIAFALFPPICACFLLQRELIAKEVNDFFVYHRDNIKAERKGDTLC